MGQAKLRGSFEQRKAAAVALARVRDEATLQARMKKRVQSDETPQVFADSRHSHRAALRTASIAGLLAASLK